jgi:hypothetical protein
VGELADLDKMTLPVRTSFRPTSPERDIFFVEFWKLPVSWIFASMIPGLIITVLFFFDHEVSSIICTIDRYGTRKPGGFAWDIILLGTTTALCGILGIPPSNGLLPQAPLHSESLMHDEPESTSVIVDGEEKIETRQVKRVYEQRWSTLLHSGAILLFVSPPFMKVLGLTPTSVLAGLFLFMGEQSLSVKYERIQFIIKNDECSLLSSPILYRTFYLLTPPSELPPLPQSLHTGTGPGPATSEETSSQNPSYFPIHLYTILQICITVVIFIVTLTRGAPAFPVLIIALVPFRLLVMKRWWPREVLRFVDAWACREGTPEDEEDENLNKSRAADEDSGGDNHTDGGARHSTSGSRHASPLAEPSVMSQQRAESHIDLADQRAWGANNDDTNHEWIELGDQAFPDEELGRQR